MKKRAFLPVLGLRHFNYIPILIITILGIGLTACNNNDDILNEWRIQGKISSLNIMDARALIVGGENNQERSFNSTAESSLNSLFKITEDGVVQEISYWQVDTIFIESEEGTEIKIDSIELTNTLYPVHIFNANDDYLIICFNQIIDNDPNNYAELEYLVRKSDGSVFELPLGYRPLTSWSHFNQMFKNEDVAEVMQTDESGAIYYIGKGDILKLDTQNPQNITFQQLTTTQISGEGVSNYRVNGQGHIIFNSEGISTPRVTRIRFNSGGLAYPEKTITPYWLGFDNNFYFSYTPEPQAGVTSNPVIEKLTINNEQISYEVIGEVNHPDAELTYMGISSCMFRMESINKIVVVDFGDPMEQSGHVVAEVYNSDNQIKSFSMDELGISSIKIGLCSEDHYYLAGLNLNQPVLLKVDPSVYPHSVQHLVPEGSYDVYQMAVTSDNYILIHALRMSDGNTVVSQISPSGEITQMEDIGTDIIQLVQVF